MISTPITKHPAIISQSFLFLISAPPIPWPRGVMDISAPSWKNPIPTMRKTAPARNKFTAPSSIGTITTLRIKTIIVIGSTLARDSFTFSLKFSTCFSPTFFRQNKIAYFISYHVLISEFNKDFRNISKIFCKHFTHI